MWLFVTVLFVILVVSFLYWRLQKRRNAPCERCAKIESLTRYYGSATTIKRYYERPLHLCFRCTLAHENFIDHLFMLSTEKRLHFGREGLMKEAERQWGPDALKIIALLELAHENMDSARRILKEDSFNRVKPWIEEQLMHF